MKSFPVCGVLILCCTILLTSCSSDDSTIDNFNKMDEAEYSVSFSNLFTTEGYLATFNKIARIYSIQESSKFLSKLESSEGFIGDIQIEQNKIYYLYQYQVGKKNQGEIHSYALEDGKKIGKTVLEMDKDWEDMTFVLVDGDGMLLVRKEWLHTPFLFIV